MHKHFAVSHIIRGELDSRGDHAGELSEDNSSALLTCRVMGNHGLSSYSVELK